MANCGAKHELRAAAYSSITKQAAENEDELEAASTTSWCGCFGLGQKKKYNQESRVMLKQNGFCKDSWLVTELKNFKEFSESRKVVKCSNWRRSKGRIHCVYSPESYALNFDDGGHGHGRQGEEEAEEFFVRFRSGYC